MKLRYAIALLVLFTALWLAFVAVLDSAIKHAGASPPPTITSVQHKLARLTSRVQVLDQQHDLLREELRQANGRLASITKQEARDSLRFESERRSAAQIAAQAYEAGLTSYAGLLMTDDPQAVLDKGSILLELSSGRRDVMHQLVQAARQLYADEKYVRGVTSAIGHMRAQIAAQRKTLVRAIGYQRSLLAQLSPGQAAGTGPGGGGTLPPIYHGPTRTQAQRAVAYAYAQIGKPYLWGGTGPAAFDCSGLTMEAWAHAGVSIPRTSEEQWGNLPHVPLSQIRPGDLLVFNGASHIGIYVGHGMLIDAPHSGAFVERVALAGWYISSLDGVVRP